MGIYSSHTKEELPTYLIISRSNNRRIPTTLHHVYTSSSCTPAAAFIDQRDDNNVQYNSYSDWQCIVTGRPFHGHRTKGGSRQHAVRVDQTVGGGRILKESFQRPVEQSESRSELPNARPRGGEGVLGTVWPVLSMLRVAWDGKRPRLIPSFCI